ncbi:tyrosine-protein kinase receptor-like isoform X2 [Tachypleus tridentatus]|uniref:tyrosine-protein kinase receptor-like isoform X2 n=1 Tax=Tachypleus tridentatus TaxID=6853 RepID=UPI003FCF3206
MRQSKGMMGDSSRGDGDAEKYKLLHDIKMSQVFGYFSILITHFLFFFQCSTCSEFDCDFEKPCAWTWAKNPSFVAISPTNISQFLTLPIQQVSSVPKMDASNKTDGYYLFYAVNRSDSLKFAKIESPWLTQGSEGQCFLEVWFHMYNMSQGTVKILIKNDQFITSMADHFLGNNRSRWEIYKKTIGRIPKPFQVIIEIEEGSEFAGHVAIDNLQLKHCVREAYIPCSPNHFQCVSKSCINRNKVCDIHLDCQEGEDEKQLCDEIPEGARCSFEDGMCGWISESRRDSEWKLHSGPTPVPRTGPSVDNTFQNATGKYVWASFHPKHARLGHVAIMNSSIFEPPPLYQYDVHSNYYNSCQVRFFYHMYGNNMGELILYVQEKDPEYPFGRKILLWRIYGNQGNLWKRAAVPLPKLRSNFHLQFVATRGLRHRCDMAVDDISLSPECFGLGVPKEVFQKYQTTPSPKSTVAVQLSNVSKRYTFTTCGAKGPEGPSSVNCEKVYLKTGARVAVVEDFPYKGAQMWTVPESGVYTVFARGAGGGQGVKNRDISGGAFLRAVYHWNAGEKIFFLVGQQGVSACTKDTPISLKRRCYSKPGKRSIRKLWNKLYNSNQRGGGGGGGGGTFVYTLHLQSHQPILLTVAAGGGGLSYNRPDDPAAAIDPSGRGVIPGLSPGNGVSSHDGAGGGGGWNDTDYADQGSTSGRSFLNGARGGYVCKDAFEWKTHGGFGGGGGACTAGGGGGGYRGGDAAVEDTSYSNGNGGTSYFNPVSAMTLEEAGVNPGDGQVDVIPAHKGCGCEFLCVTLSLENKTFSCICPQGYSLGPDGLSCRVPVKSESFHLPMHQLIVIILCVFVTLAVVLFFSFLASSRYRKRHIRDVHHEPLSSAEVQLNQLRQNGGVLTDYNPNYEFGGSMYTVKDLSEIPRENLTLIKALGQGAFGEVYSGYLGDTPVAVKTLPEQSSSQAEMDFLMEALIMSKFNHPNIVKFMGVCFDKMPKFIILELLSGGDLKTFLKENRIKCNKSNLSMKKLLAMVMDVGKGCQYLEELHFIHRDLAARNCLLTTRDLDSLVKIADFGMARDIYRADYYRKGGKTILPVKWMPPEAFLDGIFTSKTDIWSFGVLLWEVMSLGYMPYPGRSNQEVMQLVTSGGRLEPPSMCPKPVYHIMMQCWHPVPEERPSFTTIIERLGYCMQDPDVVNSTLPELNCSSLMEQDDPVMRPPDTENACLQINRPHPDLQSPGSEDYLIPMPSSNYSLNTEKTELQSSVESMEKLLDLEDKASVSSRNNKNGFHTMETSFIQADQTNRAFVTTDILQSSLSDECRKDNQDEGTNLNVSDTHDSMSLLKSSIDATSNHHNSGYGASENPKRNQNINQQRNESCETSPIKRASSVGSLESLPFVSGGNKPPVLSNSVSSNDITGQDHRSDISLDASALSQQLNNQPIVYNNVDMNFNSRSSIPVNRFVSCGHHVANKSIYTDNQPATNEVSSISRNLDLQEREIHC